jgi:hypothetical protein
MTPTVSFAAAKIGRRTFPFTTAEEVSSAYRATIDRLDLGASRAPSCDLLDSNGHRVGYVSYNGKVWSGDWDAGTAVCVFNPYAEAA